MDNLQPDAPAYDIYSDPDRIAALKIAAQADQEAYVVFDRLTRLAAKVMNVPIAVITSNEGSRMLFISKCGLPAEWDGVVETPVSASPGSKVLETGLPFVCSDVRSDAQYSSWEPLHQLGMLSYAGIPLITSDNHIVGTFCVLDNMIRDWSAEEIAHLDDLAQATVGEIELRAARHLYAKFAADLAQQNQYNVELLERQHRTEQQLMQLGFDATARERAETARMQVESILAGITDGFFALDQSMRFTYINDLAETLLHRSRGELIDTRLTDHPTPPELVHRLRQALAAKAPMEFEYDDTAHGASYELLAYPSANGLSVHFHDVTERKRSLQEIERRSDELQALSRRLVEVQEQERGQIARELHDEVGQILTGLKLTLSAARRLSDSARDAQLDSALKLVNELIGHVRNLSLDLRPAMLDDLGLLPALLWHFERYTSQTGVEVTFSQSDIDHRFHSAVETAAYRIVQEALTNVARYSQVTEASVAVHNTGSALRIKIQDAGVGFEPSGVERSGRSNGVTGMRERVNLLGGQFLIESAPGEGATIQASIPFPDLISSDMDYIPSI